MASVPLIVVGGSVQAGGFFLALRDAIRTRREEIPDHPALHRKLAARLLRKIERVLAWAKLRSPRTYVDRMAGTISATGDMDARLSFRRSGLPIDERFEALEGEVQDLAAKQQEDHETLQGKIADVGKAIDATAGRLKSERKQRLVRALHREEVGTWAFIIGVGISTVGAIV